MPEWASFWASAARSGQRVFEKQTKLPIIRTGMASFVTKRTALNTKISAVNSRTFRKRENTADIFYFLETALRYTTNAMTAEQTSVAQKACQTPVGPIWRQSTHASGMMKMT